MIKQILIIHILLNILAGFSAQAQFSTKNKRAIKYFTEAESHFVQAAFMEARFLLEKSIKADKNFFEAYLLLADCSISEGRLEEAKNNFLYVIEHDKGKIPEARYFFANMLYGNGEYKAALKYFTQIEENNTVRVDSLKLNTKIKSCKFAIAQLKKPLDIDFMNVGPEINTENSEYRPILPAKNNKLIYTALVKLKNYNPNYPDGQEDFFISHLDNNVWTDGFAMPRNINTYGNEGAHSLSSDGKTIFFTACNRKGGYGSCDLYTATLYYETVHNIKALPAPINSQAWDSQPSVSANGNMLFFSSSRKGGFGKKDIWYCTLSDDGRWSAPQNLGATVNSAGNESNPYIHHDSQTLYFAADNHIGMGGYDLYKCTIIGDSLTEPVNLGYPINTHKHETDFFVTTNGQVAYVASERDGGYGKLDIWQFNIPQHLRPNPMVFIEGTVFNSKTNKPVQAQVNLCNSIDHNCDIATRSDENGEFLRCFKSGSINSYRASRIGFFPTSGKINLHASDTSYSLTLRIPLKPIKPGAEWVLRNTHFETNSHKLKTDSYAELNQLVSFLKANPSVRAEISGHSDNTGSEKLNKQLSAERAKTVYSYLTKRGIGANRLEHKGYADTQPVADNHTEEGRALNRRTQLTIL